VKTLQYLAPLGTLLAGLTMSNPGLADLPPPDGTKFVGYSFVIENVGAFPDYVVFAYPWSLSNGAPTREHIRIGTDRPVELGRRSPTPKLYAMPRAAYEEWAKTFKPQDDRQGRSLDELVKRPDVVLCTGAPAPRFSLGSDDKRNAVLETLRATRIDKGVCEIATELTPKTEPATPTVASPVASPVPSPVTGTATTAAGTPPVSTGTQDPAAPPGRGGCGSCAVGTGPGDTAASWSAALVALLFGRRRRPSATSSRRGRRLR
jgi:MYXO-CTERM domain-containing protein